MKKLLSKIVCIASTITLCGIYALPVYAISDKQTLYAQMDNIGEVYNTVSNGEKQEDEIPIETEIKYYLNDEEISAEDIKGKSGKVKIEINYTNKNEETVEIDGKEVKMYIPYLVASGMILDNDKFQNVTISSGKIIDNGSNTIVLGIALPGMQESLDLSVEDIEIPENITIEADATDFELGNMYMYIESNLFDSDSLDFLDEFEGIYDDMQDLKSASSQLVSGSKTLKEGTETYAEKIGEFNTGLSKYTNGVSTISSNYTKINDGISEINSNAKKIADGSSSVADGITELKTSLSTLISGMAKIKEGTDGMYSSIGKMIESVDTSIEELTESTSKTSDTTKTLTALGTATETSIYKLESTKSALEKTVDKMADSTEKTELLNEIESLDSQLKDLKTNVSTERGAYQTAIEKETTSILAGLNQLKTAMNTLQGVSLQVKNGVDNIVDNSSKLQDGLDELESGSNSLSKGAEALSSGTSTLASGADELNDGIKTLNSSTETLVDSSNKLKDGAETLSTGANTLADGMKEFDNSGINTIYNLVNGDVKSAQNRIEKLMDLTKKNENSSSYKYIIKTDSL